ncbi:MAG: phosphopentomutase [Oscillospiraceae bacterium]|nr:phosphopentomutase [Oscillospiraceae bacterium]
MKQFKRVLLFLLDSVGVGALPDAESYGDGGTATVQHTILGNPGLTLPNLEALGLMQIPGLEAFSTGKSPIGVYGKCLEKSKGKDSIVGHWEVMGVPTTMAFDTFPDGFPQHVIDAFSQAIGRGVLGNEVASGTEIIARLGEEHQKTGFPIVYTSADSVFQIAAHEETVPLATLYQWCETARTLLDGMGFGVGRIIARPFVGTPGNYTRTANRHDYAARPPKETDLELLTGAGIPIHSIGKPVDIFPQASFSSTVKTSDNTEGMAQALKAAKEKEGLIFINLLDYDMKWGHRRDVKAYGDGLKAFDDFLPTLMDAMDDDTLLVITADHGCDPTHTGSDHTREHIPVLLWHRGIIPAAAGIRETFGDVGATVLAALGAPKPEIGVSILD